MIAGRMTGIKAQNPVSLLIYRDSLSSLDRDRAIPAAGACRRAIPCVRDKQVGSACGYAEPRPCDAEARHQRKFALGVPAFAKATARSRRSSRELNGERRRRAPAPVKKVGESGTVKA